MYVNIKSERIRQQKLIRLIFNYLTYNSITDIPIKYMNTERPIHLDFMM